MMPQIRPSDEERGHCHLPASHHREEGAEGGRQGGERGERRNVRCEEGGVEGGGELLFE